MSRRYTCKARIARRRGVMTWGPHVCTDARLVCQAKLECMRVSFTVHVKKSSWTHCTELASIRPHLLRLGLISQKDPSLHLVSILRLRSPFTFATSFDSSLPPTSWLHVHLPADVRSFLPRLPPNLAPSSNSISTAATAAATPSITLGDIRADI